MLAKKNARRTNSASARGLPPQTSPATSGKQTEETSKTVEPRAIEGKSDTDLKAIPRSENRFEALNLANLPLEGNLTKDNTQPKKK